MRYLCYRTAPSPRPGLHVSVHGNDFKQVINGSWLCFEALLEKGEFSVPFLCFCPRCGVDTI